MENESFLFPIHALLSVFSSFSYSVYLHSTIIETLCVWNLERVESCRQHSKANSKEHVLYKAKCKGRVKMPGGISRVESKWKAKATLFSLKLACIYFFFCSSTRVCSVVIWRGVCVVVMQKNPKTKNSFSSHFTLPSLAHLLPLHIPSVSGQIKHEDLLPFIS